MTKKISGYLFIVIAVLLILALFGQFSAFLSSVENFLLTFTGRLTAYEAGEAFGHLIYWTIHILAIILLLKYARKWLVRKAE